MIIRTGPRHGLQMETRPAMLCCVLLGILAVLAVFAPAAAAQSFTVLHEFGGTDGANPVSSVVRDAAGNLYGATSGGGATFGVVYKVDKSGAESVLFDFDITDGAFPTSDLILDKAGNLYSTALEGPGGAGILFRLTPGEQEKIIYAFQGGQGSKAAVPAGGPITDKSGNFYGATLRGGLGVGTIYKVTPSGKLHVLYKFTDGADGADPQGPLVQDADGNFYGAAMDGGAQSRGTLFKLSRDGKLTVLHTFTNGADGGSPQGGLLMDKRGNLYGTTFVGGDSGNGTIFELTKAGAFKRLYSFTGGNDGANPSGGLIQDEKGNLYGTAAIGGAYTFYGTVFKLSPGHQLTVLHAFTGGQDGANPFCGLVRDLSGNLYGTTDQNFLFNQRDGTLFKITP